MKTQTFGIYNRSLYIETSATAIRFADLPWWETKAVQEYRSKRENGNDSDNPNWQFPKDGKFTWIKGTVKDDGYVYGVKESDGNYHYEIRYDEGDNDKRWMRDKDIRYLARLEKEGKLEKEEPEEFRKRQALKQEETRRELETRRRIEEEQRRKEAEQKEREDARRREEERRREIERRKVEEEKYRVEETKKQEELRRAEADRKRREDEERKKREEQRKIEEEERLFNERFKKSAFVVEEKSSAEQVEILRRLRDNTCVTTLSLKGLKLTEEVRKELVGVLANNKVLRSLDLSSSQLTDDSVLPIVDVLQSRQNSTLIELKIDGKPIIDVLRSRQDSIRIELEHSGSLIKKRYLAEIYSYLKRNKILSKMSHGIEIEPERQEVDVEIPSDYECSFIAHLIMLDPVFTSDGHTYEREAITEWLKDHDTSPATGLKLEDKRLTPNIRLKSLIERFLKEHPELWRSDAIYVSELLKAKLLEAVATGNANDIRRYVDMDKRFLWVRLNSSGTLLDLAVNQSKPEVLSTVVNLLSNSIFGDIFWEQLDGSGVNLFRLAAKNMRTKGAEIIFKKLEWSEKDVQRELFEAIKDGALSVALASLDLGAKINVCDEAGNYPVHLAVIHNNLETLRFLIGLISQKANFNVVDSNGDTPLLLAVRRNSVAMARDLISLGNIEAVDRDGNTPLLLSIKKGHFEMFKDLMAAKANVHCTDQEGNTPLHLAARLGNREMIEWLMKAGANIKTKNSQGQKPVALARAAGKPETAKFIEELDLRLRLRPILESMQKEDVGEMRRKLEEQDKRLVEQEKKISVQQGEILLLKEEIKSLKNPSLSKEKEKPTPSVSELLTKFGNTTKNVPSAPLEEHEDLDPKKKCESDFDPAMDQ